MKYLATVENLIEKWDEPNNFAFDIGYIVIHGVDEDDAEFIQVTFGDKNFYKTLAPIYASKDVKKLQEVARSFHIERKKSAYRAMTKLVSNDSRKPIKMPKFASLHEAIVSLELDSGEKPTIVEVGNVLLKPKSS